jgi:serine/threonine protein phosphatase PrpC
MGEKCVAKLLRLDVAQLTDVGRKRDHNEDNMAYVIPKDPQVMAYKGALFIVADGMGGHAAGEVASEIAVDTVSNAYYQDDNDDVRASLLQAIRRANAAIHQRAAENMLRSGMGTTCVAAVLRGNVAYIANVGDSRAYLVRKSQIRQVSQDHSWVAEQVRAGLLTEEQARTHAQRNVITRSLGTQPEVEIDFFQETLEDGDSLILCSDGLSGLVNDEELQRTVEQFVPQESVYHLIERANENGGPDNITAIVAHIQEVGVEPPGVRQPVPAGGLELSNEDTARLFAPLGAGTSMAARGSDSPLPSSPFSYTISGPLASPDSDTAPQPVLRAKKRHGRLFAPTVALAILFLLVAVGSGFYYFIHVNQAQTINQTLSDASQLISRASTELNQNPAQALQDLAQAQQKLQDLAKNYALSSGATSQMASLQNQLVGETRTAITNYDQGAKITLLPCTSSTPGSLSQGIAQTLAFVQNNNSVIYYALGQDGRVYQLIQSNSSNGTSQYTLSNPFTLPGTSTQITAITGAKNAIFALSQQVTNNTPDNFAINLLSPGSDSQLQPGHTQPIDGSLTQNGQTPSLITAWNAGGTTNVYVVLASTSNTNSATILSYSVDTKGNFKGQKTTSISVSERIMSITASDNRLFMLLGDGSIWSMPLNSATTSTPAPVLVDAPIAPPLGAQAQNFTANTPVPTVTPPTSKGSGALAVPPVSNPATLSGGTVTDTNGLSQFHLFVGDPANHRVLNLTFQQPLATSGGPGATPTATSTSNGQGASVTMSLVQQYVSPTYFAKIKDVVIDPSTTTPGGTTIDILGQSASNNESLMFINSQKACAS